MPYKEAKMSDQQKHDRDEEQQDQQLQEEELDQVSGGIDTVPLPESPRKLSFRQAVQPTWKVEKGEK